jgi:hypothetical protein
MVKENPPSGHRYNPWHHTHLVISLLPPDPSLRLAGLFHDVGKVYPTYKEEGHSKRSAEIMEKVLSSWAIDKKIRKKAVAIVEHHSFHTQALLSSPGKRRRFLSEVGNLYKDLLLFRKADRYAQGWGKGDDDLQELKELLKNHEKETFPRKPSELPVDREALLTRLKVPLKRRKEFLLSLWEWVLEDPEKRNEPKKIEEEGRTIRETLSQGKESPLV